jgi:hypothetical protein
MKLRRLIPFLLVSATLAACTTPMTPAQREDSAKAQSYFTRKIQVADSGGARIDYTAVELRNTPAGYVVTYFGGPNLVPLRTERVSECSGETVPNLYLLCKLQTGDYLAASIGFIQESKDIVITDERLIKRRNSINIKKGELLILVHHPPSEDLFAGKIVGE